MEPKQKFVLDIKAWNKGEVVRDDKFENIHRGVTYVDGYKLTDLCIEVCMSSVEDVDATIKLLEIAKRAFPSSSWNRSIPPVYCIYKNPADYPNKYVVRRWIGTTPDIEPMAVEDNYKCAVNKIPIGCVNVGRSRSDDPAILESWI